MRVVDSLKKHKTTIGAAVGMSWAQCRCFWDSRVSVVEDSKHAACCERASAALLRSTQEKIE
jgi:hypothetical protein